MDILLVGVGGALGSTVRFILGKAIQKRSKTLFPVGTFIINITGAILLGIVSSLNTDRNVYLLIGDGFLGAYTTFSTFMYEGFNLFKNNEKMNAAVYIAGSLIVGIAGFIVGSNF